VRLNIKKGNPGACAGTPRRADACYVLEYNQSMTIREYYELSWKRTTYGIFATVIAVEIAYCWCHPDMQKQHAVLLAWVLGGVGAVAHPILFHCFIYRCPRCHADFMKPKSKWMEPSNRDKRFYWQIWDACPHCHVSFDEPWDGANR
jgi:hypothetical protein